jgi:hypothetical protein
MAATTTTMIALALAAAAAGTSAYNTNKTNHRIDEENAAGLRRQNEKQRKADTVVDKLIKDTGDSSPEGEKNNAMAQFQKALAASSGMTNSGLGGVAGASDRFNTEQQQAATGVSQYGNEVADRLARIDAPRYQRQREGNMRDTAGVDIGIIKRESAGEEFLNKLKLQGIRRNPWLDAAATAMSSYAGSMGGASAAGSAGAAGGSAPGWWDASGQSGWGGI